MYETTVPSQRGIIMEQRSSIKRVRMDRAALVLILLAGVTLGLSPHGWAQASQTSGNCTSKELAARSDALDRREQALNSAEAQLNARLADLKMLEGKLTNMLNEAKSIKDARLVHLIGVYTNMKPRQAGAALEALDVPTAVKILAGMKGRQAGDILSNVSAKKAAELSDALTKLQMGPDLPQKP